MPVAAEVAAITAFNTKKARRHTPQRADASGGGGGYGRRIALHLALCPRAPPSGRRGISTKEGLVHRQQHRRSSNSTGRRLLTRSSSCGKEEEQLQPGRLQCKVWDETLSAHKERAQNKSQWRRTLSAGTVARRGNTRRGTARHTVCCVAPAGSSTRRENAWGICKGSSDYLYCHVCRRERGR